VQEVPFGRGSSVPVQSSTLTKLSSKSPNFAPMLSPTVDAATLTANPDPLRNHQRATTRTATPIRPTQLLFPESGQPFINLQFRSAFAVLDETKLSPAFCRHDGRRGEYQPQRTTRYDNHKSYRHSHWKITVTACKLSIFLLTRYLQLKSHSACVGDQAGVSVIFHTGQSIVEPMHFSLACLCTAPAKRNEDCRSPSLFCLCIILL
jgi:hypothetical protein